MISNSLQPSSSEKELSETVLFVKPPEEKLEGELIIKIISNGRFLESNIKRKISTYRIVTMNIVLNNGNGCNIIKN